jgi:hypothetical protein
MNRLCSVFGFKSIPGNWIYLLKRFNGKIAPDRQRKPSKGYGYQDLTLARHIPYPLSIS